MKNEEMEKFTKNIKEKLGEENSSLISDDLGKMITENASMNIIIENKENELKEEKEKNIKLIQANNSLLQQVSSSFSANDIKDEKKEEIINWEDCFDEKGQFKK